MKTEVVYLGSDDTFEIALHANGAPVALDAVSRMTLLFLSLDLTIDSELAGHDGAIAWGGQIDQGCVRFRLGHIDGLVPGMYLVILRAYDAANQAGLVLVHPDAAQLRIHVVEAE